MAAAHDEPPTLRCDSPPPDAAPTAALGASGVGMARCLSVASSVSHGSATTDNSHVRESLGSDMSSYSRASSASYRRSDVSFMTTSSRQSTGSIERSSSRRRGYMRPQGTDFAASARSRESVLSLGSIVHLQYYFARTGLLDLKGAQLARKNRRAQKAATLDFSSLDPSAFSSALPTPRIITTGSDVDSSYASMGSSPDLVGQSFSGNGASSTLVESPVQEDGLEQTEGEDAYSSDFDFDEPDPSTMLPPTVSTYHHREKPLPKPPTIEELKADLRGALDVASRALEEAKKEDRKKAKAQAAQAPQETLQAPASPDQSSPSSSPSSPSSPSPPGWYEVQGMHILDVMTLAIRAAKVYYTSHEQPERLDAIKPEKEVRSELLSVMDALKRMATRHFAGGMREDELQTMESWIEGLYAMLRAEEDMEDAERAEIARWTWLRDEDWPPGTEAAREYAFIQSMLDDSSSTTTSGGGLARSPGPEQTAFFSALLGPLPEWTPIDRSAPLESQALPTPFLKGLQSGVRLVQLHNAAVRRSRRRFGAIGAFHTDTGKPYRAADNLRFWAKAAELRWEVLLKVDALGVVYDSGPRVWLELEDAVLAWCRKVREEIAAEIRQGAGGR
ncbi:KAR9-domain-containing protein [Pleurostoma richardsiae]|uniref:KAR9-domain-containing protein n=1 Tax=Pleurostoma richardsiae TaxID=41990 RepID=A0AA38S6P1_9PEZI|nr:KAR9-domain-containing protein [Pleurostoma richardsiae]